MALTIGSVLVLIGTVLALVELIRSGGVSLICWAVLLIGIGVIVGV